MGYMVHHALVVTGSARSDYRSAAWPTAEDAHAVAVEIAKRLGACEVTAPTPESTNGYRSFMIAPDGSKAGWQTSHDGDQTRAEMVAWLRDKTRSGWFSWAVVRFGDEGGDNCLEDHDNDGAA